MFGTMYERNWSHCANQLVITNLLTPRTWVLLSFCLWSFEVGTIMYPHRFFSKIILLYTSLKGTKEEKWKEMEPIYELNQKRVGSSWATHMKGYNAKQKKRMQAFSVGLGPIYLWHIISICTGSPPGEEIFGGISKGRWTAQSCFLSVLFLGEYNNVSLFKYWNS